MVIAIWALTGAVISLAIMNMIMMTEIKYLRGIININDNHTGDTMGLLRDTMFSSFKDQAEALDAHATELDIIKKHLGIKVHWDRAKDGKVTYTAPDALAKEEIDGTN